MVKDTLKPSLTYGPDHLYLKSTLQTKLPASKCNKKILKLDHFSEKIEKVYSR